jgi:hypothetical protein
MNKPLTTLMTIGCLSMGLQSAHAAPLAPHAQPHDAGSELTAQRAIGSADSFHAKFAALRRAKASALEVTLSDASTVALQIDDHLQEGEYLVFRGKAQASANSSFMFKGTGKNMYGWVVLRDQDQAFEYTTDSAGQVVVQSVLVSKIFPVCNLPASTPWSLDTKALPRRKHRAGKEPHIGPYDGSDVNKLQSLPGAAHVIYLDIREVMNGDTPKYYDKEGMWDAWQAAASTYSNFEVNVTTDHDVYTAANVANTCIAGFLDQDGRSNADLNSCGTPTASRIYKYPTGDEQGRTVAHEVGHQLGLNHDHGEPGGEYFEGLPEYKWVPIMANFWFGNGWGGDALYQWSKSEYTSGTNHEDDLELIRRYLPERADDHTDAEALVVGGDGTVSAEDNRGQIGANTDSDEFTFELAGAGKVKLKVDRTEYIGGAMLDIDAAILDESGKEVARDNPKAVRSASFDLDLDAGKYTLVIKGGAEGTPSDGFPIYGSLGFYAIEGTMPSPDSTKPSVKITAPDDEDEIEIGTTIEISADADDDTAVAEVEFFADGKSLGIDESEPFEIEFETDKAEAGKVVLRAVARDAAMNEAEDEITIELVDPSDGETSTGGSTESSDDDDDATTSEDDDDDSSDDDDDTASSESDDDDDSASGDDDDDSSDDDDDDDKPAQDAETGCGCIGTGQPARWTWGLGFALLSLRRNRARRSTSSN